MSSAASVAVLTTATAVTARTFPGGMLPWAPLAATPPVPVVPGDWHFFTVEEGRTVEAIVDRLIPSDALSVGGKDAGCAVYLDRQLAGSYGSSSRLYTKGPFRAGLPTQGYQGQASPAELYRVGLAAINKVVKQGHGGKSFAELGANEQDQFLKDLEADKVTLPDGVVGKVFFGLILNGTMEGFFADPIYGGNKDMAAWKMIGFPGARYDYRDFVSRHNETYPHPPVSILGATDWTMK